MLKTLSLFTGIGGLDYGFEAAGFKTMAAVEFDPIVAKSLCLNRNWKIIDTDINVITPKGLLGAVGLKPGSVDMLIAGPPCQPFSKSAYWSSNGAAGLNDPRARTLSAFLNALEYIKPKAFLLENVPGFAFHGKAEALHFIIDGIADINRRKKTNYHLSWEKLNAAEFGVPQLRERFFIVGSREGKHFVFPHPTHTKLPLDDEKVSKLEPYRTAWDAVGDLPKVPDEDGLEARGKWANLLPSIPEGQNYLWHTNRGGGRQLFGYRTRYWSFLLKLAKSQPSWTLQSQVGSATGPFHWANRRLSTKELCRLQTLPDGLIFAATRNEKQRMIGNAVPSLLAEVLAREIKKQIFEDNSATKKKLKLLPPKRTPTPRKQPVRPVAKEYLDLIGAYDDHPGEGLGVGARRQNKDKYSEKLYA